MYSSKLTDSALRAPITTGTTMTFCMCKTFAISSFNKWYFSNFLNSLSVTLTKLIMTTSLSFLSIKTMSGLLEDQVSICSYWSPYSQAIWATKVQKFTPFVLYRGGLHKYRVGNTRGQIHNPQQGST